MEMQILLNFAFGIAGTVMGIMLNRLWSAVDHLTDQDIKLADKVQRIEVLVAGQYVQRHELDGFESRIVVRLDQIWHEMKGKADKPHNGNGGGK
jgi:hypothetical protein